MSAEQNVQKRRRLNALVSRHLETVPANNRVDSAILMDVCDTIRGGMGADFLEAIKDPMKNSTPPQQLRVLNLLDAVVMSTTQAFTLQISQEEWTERLFRVAKDGGHPEVRDRIMQLTLQWHYHHPTAGLQALVERFRKSKFVGEAFAAIETQEHVRRAQEISAREAQQAQQRGGQPQGRGGAQRTASGSFYADPVPQPVPAPRRGASMANIETFLMDTQSDISALEYGLQGDDNSMLDPSTVEDCAKHRQKAMKFVEHEGLPEYALEQLLLCIDSLTRLLSIHDALYGTSYITETEAANMEATNRSAPAAADVTPVATAATAGGAAQPAGAAAAPASNSRSLFEQAPSTGSAAAPVPAGATLVRQQSSVGNFSNAERDRMMGEIQQLREQVAEARKERDAAQTAQDDATAKYKDAKAKNKKAIAAVEELEQEKDEALARVEALESSAAKTAAVPAPKPVEKVIVKEVKREVDPAVPAKVRTTLRALRRDLQNLRETSQSLRGESKTVATAVVPKVMEIVNEAAGEAGKHQKQIKWLEDLYKKEMRLRKVYYNQIQDLKGNIRAYCRVRPISDQELTGGHKDITTYPTEDEVRVVDQNGKIKGFEFDAVFQPTSTQAKVFEDTLPLIDSVVDGYNVCIFAYGQTGSGKTHTMTGNDADPGINKRALERLFEVIDERKSTETSTVAVSVLEIYNESIRDLLVSKAECAKTSYEVRTGGKYGHYVTNLSETDVGSPKEIQAIMAKATSHRSEGATNMNLHSSRSHMIVYIVIRTKNKTTGAQSYGKLSLVDLAGSERLDKSGAEGQAAKEAVAINKSLTALGDTIASLSSSAKHVPYRNSLLTHLLQDSMSGQAKVLMFCCASPASYNAAETISSLGFATRARGVSLGQAKKNA